MRLSPVAAVVAFLPAIAAAVQRVEVKPGDNVTLALEKSRELRKARPGEAIEIVFADGVHPLSSPLHFGPEDSGTAEAPLRLIAAAGAHPVISGGVAIHGIEAKTDGHWEGKVEGPPFEQLWVNGRRAVRARVPDQGFLHSPAIREEPFEGAAKQAFELEDSAVHWLKDLTPAERAGVQVIAYHKWDTTRRRLGSFSEKSVTVTGAAMPTWNRWDGKTGFVLENVPSALDQPGEWFRDASTGTLRYLPRPGEDAAKAEIVAPWIERLIVIDGHAEAKVSHIEFQGLSFQYAGWICPQGGFDPAQAAATIEAVVQADYADAISFDRCEIAHTGIYGLWFRKGCTACKVTHTDLHDLGAGGIRIGTMEEASGTSGITVENCIVKDAGQTFACAVGVWIGFSGDNAILHNEIAYMPYTGVSVGWRWGYAASEAKRNRIEQNHIHRIGNGLLSDMGGVYTLGPSEGSVLRGNVVHDIVSYDYGGWGLYNDEGSTGMLLEDNLVYRTTSGGYHEHYGKENIVRNNIFAYARDQQLQFSKPEGHVPFHFTGNIVLWDRGPLWEGGSQGRGQEECDRNLYWQTGGGEIVSYGKKFADWQASGRDTHSVIADPGFVDPAKGDFHFKDPAVAEKIGFKAFDYTQAGVTGDEAWKKHAAEVPPDWVMHKP